MTWLDPLLAYPFPAAAALTQRTGRRETLAEFEVFSQFVGQPCAL